MAHLAASRRLDGIAGCVCWSGLLPRGVSVMSTSCTGRHGVSSFDCWMICQNETKSAAYAPEQIMELSYNHDS